MQINLQFNFDGCPQHLPISYSSRMSPIISRKCTLCDLEYIWFLIYNTPLSWPTVCWQKSLNIEPIKTTWNLFVKLFEVGQDPFISTIIFTKYCHNSCQGAHQIFSPLHKNHHGQQLGRVPLFQQKLHTWYYSRCASTVINPLPLIELYHGHSTEPEHWLRRWRRTSHPGRQRWRGRWRGCFIRSSMIKAEQWDDAQ